MITGANGFLGRNLSRALSNHELILIDREAGQDIATADINTDLHIIDPLMAGVDVVIHAANRARIDPSWNHYAEYYQTNITGSQSLLVAAQRRCVKKFIFISSSSVYGNNGTLIQSETDSLEPTNPYAVSKVAAEYALGVQSRLASTELIVVRPFTMYGEHMDYGPHGLVIGKFITAYQQGLPLELHGGGTQRRDFVHASDAVAGIKLIIAHGHGGEVYNLGSGSCVSIKDTCHGG